MGYVIEKDWMTKAGYRAVVIMSTDRTENHRCGYVGVSKDHPLFGLGYSDKSAALRPANDDEEIGDRGAMTLLFGAVDEKYRERIDFIFDVHGSLTFSGNGKEGAYPVQSDLWWFGFDAAHHGDDMEGGRSLAFMAYQCERLADQFTSRVIFAKDAA